MGGIVDETLWARLLFTVTDDYGNQFSKYNDDYFVLGDSEGDLDINWVDEDSEEIMINWGWEAKHSVMIKRSAIANYLQPGDKITLVDNLDVLLQTLSTPNAPPLYVGQAVAASGAVLGGLKQLKTQIKLLSSKKVIAILPFVVIASSLLCIANFNSASNLSLIHI